MTQAEFDAIADEFGVEHPFEVGKKYGLSRDEALELMRVHNEGIMADWAFEFAKRTGRPISEVRAEVLRQRQLAAQHCNEVYRREVGIKESKEDEMAKNAAAQTTIDMNVNTESKEDTTMTENAAAKTVNANEQEDIMTITGIPTKTRKNGNIAYDRPTDIARHEAIRAEFNPGRVKGIEVTNCIPGLSWKNFTDDPAEVELLGKVCKKMGWVNGVTTVAKAMDYNGKPNPDYEGHGWLVQYKPYVYKTGERAGTAKEPTKTVVYPMEAFVWDTESGMPEFDEDKAAMKAARKAKAALNQAAKALKDANAAAGIKPKRKTSHKPAAKQVVADLPVAAAGPAKLIHIKLANGVEFDARDAKEAAELKALFE